MDVHILEITSLPKAKKFSDLESKIMASGLGFALEASHTGEPDCFKVYSIDRLPLQELGQSLSQAYPQLSLRQTCHSMLDWDCGWSDETQKVWKTQTLSFTVQSEAKVDSPDSKVIRLRESEAFGDGRHVATRLTVGTTEAALLQKSAAIPSFLDFGAGSGVVAIAAERLGVKEIWACEIDPDALAVAQEHARMNHCQAIRFCQTLPENQTFAAIACNIQPPLLFDHLFELTSRLLPEGFIVLSGYTTLDQDAIASRMRKLGFKLQARHEERGWLGTCWES